MISEPQVQNRLKQKGNKQLLSLQQQEQFLRAHVNAGDVILLALSGGVDSISLLSILNELRPKIGFGLELAHVDHCARAESAADAAYLQSLAQELQLVLHLHRAQCSQQGENFEAWGRKTRYDFFAELRKERQLSWVLTAHTSDDQLETLLMQLISNKSTRGITQVDWQRRLLRPLLGVDKSDLYDLVQKKGLKFLEDQSNLDESYLRNRVRGSLLPKVAELFGEAAIVALKQQAQSLVEDQAVLDRLACQAADSFLIWNFGSKAWFAEVKANLLTQPQALRWRILEQVFLPHLGFRLGQTSCLALTGVFLENVAGLDLPGAWRVLLAHGGLKLVKLESES